jgi:hypothetical protein
MKKNILNEQTIKELENYWQLKNKMLEQDQKLNPEKYNISDDDFFKKANKVILMMDKFINENR